MVAVAYGGAKLYPRFQFREGDVIPEVADLNEKLFRRLAKDRERAEVSWDVLEWWVTPIQSAHASASQAHRVDP